ncbi:hypothetical protein K7X08_030980 [Anisodus acutangulus]|uniref:Uncharacterized protein n=1 Tax=Anisodus acutangulus TaxID=402998 RepID=A0A9Q1MY65_9SOLA|nr:hypothetical protein K7X08_030980 [Anisodus acutangulus]
MKLGAHLKRVTKGKQTKVGRKTKKRIRSLINEDDEGMARSPPVVGLTIEEELELTAPQPTQTSQASTRATPLPSQASSSVSQMSTRSMLRQQPINSAFNVKPDFEFPSNEESEQTIMPMSILEAKTRFRRQMQVGEATGTRCIGFVGDANDVSKPTNFSFLPRS